MSQAWQILLVDDEPDIHGVTRLSLKRKTWKGQRFDVTSAYSRAEAEKVIQQHPRPFDVGFIDVVMESDQAGLELCRFIRQHCPRSFRIVLRTGQPGIAPEEYVLNEYDIDYYLAKTEATPDRLYNVMRACLRSSEDIATMIAYGDQLQDFTRALSSTSPMEDILGAMKTGLRFLELKHQTSCTFVADAAQPATALASPGSKIELAQLAQIVHRIAGDETLSPHTGADLGLPKNSAVLPFRIEELADDRGGAEPGGTVVGGLCAEFDQGEPSPKELSDFFGDARPFVDNWRVAFSTLKLQNRLVQEMMLRMDQAREKAVMEKELEVASAVQSTMVPGASLIELGGIDLAGYLCAATQCGGDWWNYYRLADDKILVIVGDVTGHGAGAAMITATAKAAATTVIEQRGGNVDLPGLLHTINVAIIDAAKGSFLMTCFASVYDPRTRTVAFANAGHNFPYVLDEGKLSVLANTGVRLGDISGAQFAVRETAIAPGGTIIWFTDGLVEMENAAGDELSDRWLRKRIKKLAHLEPEQLRDEIVAGANEFAAGTPLKDDVTLVVGKVR